MTYFGHAACPRAEDEAWLDEVASELRDAVAAVRGREAVIAVLRTLAVNSPRSWAAGTWLPADLNLLADHIEAAHS